MPRVNRNVTLVSVVICVGILLIMTSEIRLYYNKIGSVRVSNSTGVYEKDAPYVPFVKALDPFCNSKEKTYFRDYEGRCNWLEVGQADIGTAGKPFGRDRPPHFKNGTTNLPREGPNPRELSNIFFKNHKTKYWGHTFFLTAFVETLVHDIMLSASGREKGDVYNIPVPKGDAYFDPEHTGTVTMPFWRTKRAEGTGKRGIPRENSNDQTPWIDLSSVYGISKEENKKVRTGREGKLILERDGYLPFNNATFAFNMVGYPKKGDNTLLFAVPNVRANVDFGLMAFHTLLVREHNRICDLLISRYPNRKWNDEELFQYARVMLNAKFMMIGSAYFLAYFKDTMPTSTYKSALSIYQWWTDQTLLTVNPLTLTYPYKPLLDPVTNAPSGLPNEFSVLYRWHTLLPARMSLVNKCNIPYALIEVTENAYNATAFKMYGIDDVLRGMAVTDIPDFHSGTAETYRSMVFDFHDPKEGMFFDIVAWAIEHERERGIPTFNEYIRGYDGKVPFSPRKTFEEFTDNPEFVKELKRLYKTPDDVDAFVGQELDPTFWPHTNIPTSMLIMNFYTLFKASVMDRFQPGYSVSWCLTGKDQRPWNCQPSNALDELLWQQVPWLWDGFRVPDTFWFSEIDYINQGTRLLHKMIIDNTDVECLQQDPFFMPNVHTNPIICYEKTGGQKYEKAFIPKPEEMDAYRYFGGDPHKYAGM